MRLCLAVLGLVFLLLHPGPARADFGDCADPGYLGTFPDAPSAASILCVEHYRIDIATPSGPRTIRAISDVAAGWAVPPALLSATEQGARAAAAAMPALGDFATDDITLLLLDDVHSFDPGRRILAMADGRGGAGGGRAGECLVTLYGLSASGDPTDIAVTVAHEIFHCVQYASLTTAQMGTYGSGGDWWIEGSADYFAGLAVPGSQPHTDRGAAFDAGVDAGTPINAMAHEAGVFFFWLGQERGPAGLMPFLRAMSASGGAGAQQDAMRAALGNPDWLRFAQAYVDGAISHPLGGALSLSPSPSQTLSITGPGPQRLTLEPFTLVFATVDHDCGTWGNTVTPGDANLALREESGRDWAPWPDEIDVREGRPGTWWIAALHTGSGPLDVRNEVERRRACEPCGPIDHVDACLNGTWQMTGGGPVEWMRSQGLPITNVSEGPRFVTFRSDGIYGTEPLDLSITLREGDTVARGEGFATAAFGRWSAKDGQMYVCQDAGGVSGTVTVTTPRSEGSGPVSQSGGGMLDMRYACAGGSLTTTLQIPGLSPMTTQYGKIADEVPRP